MKKFDVVGFGALNVDRLGLVDTVSVDGETVVQRETRVAGGSAANTIAALGRFGLKTAFIGTIGDDSNGKLIINSFQQESVNTSLISKKPGESGTVIGVFDYLGHRALYVFPGVNSQLELADIPAKDTLSTKFLHLSSFCDERQLDIQIQLVGKMAKETKVSLAPGMIYAKFGMNRLTPLLNHCYCIFLTKEELSHLTNEEESKGENTLLSQGVEIIVITKGKDGCTVVTKKKRFDLSCLQTQAVDTTGAGDAYAAGFLYGLLHDIDLETSTRIGNFVASSAISAVGSREGIPSKERLLEEMKRLTKPKKLKEEKRDILIIGSGGREHALGWKLKQSTRVRSLYFAPGNGGTAQIGTNVAIAVEDIDALLKFAKSKQIGMTIVGPEAALAKGIVDAFENERLKIFGPSLSAAKLETSKAWALEFMDRHGILHPYSKVFDIYADAVDYAEKQNGKCVIKADGLAQGKGVFVCHSIEESIDALDEIMIKKTFGFAGDRVVIQELLIGREVSAMAICDGTTALPLIFAQDYKSAYDGNKGPNTGGMGSIAPAPNMTSTLTKKIHRLLSLIVEGMRKEGKLYKGVLYVGIIVADEDLYVLEFNCRFGDPETQVQLPLLQNDLLDLFDASINERLFKEAIRFSLQSAVCVVLVSDGYPGSYKTGYEIFGIDDEVENTLVFQAGTKMHEGKVVTNGGRVLGITGTGSTLRQARQAAYARTEKIRFTGKQYRGDIARKGLIYSP